MSYECNVDQGGLMRCCLQTIHEHAIDPDSRYPEEGETLDCKWCTKLGDQVGQMIFRDGAWHWAGAVG